MKNSSLIIIVVAAGLYYSIVLLFRGFLRPDYTPPLYFLVAPLAALVLFLIADLNSRATVRSDANPRTVQPRIVGRQVGFLTRQIETGIYASPGYFDHVLRTRLREILIEKIASETGMERERVKELLANKLVGPRVLHDTRLHDLLYSGTPARGHDRVKLLEEVVELIDGWKA